MGQDAFIHETAPANINLPLGENLTIFRKATILRNPPDAAAPFQVVHPDGYIEPIATATGGAGVQTVTGYNVDNTDPANPVILPVVVDTSIAGTGEAGTPFSIANTAWLLNGNATTVKEFMGSTTPFDIGFITDGIERLTITTNGSVYNSGRNAVDSNTAFGNDALVSNTTGISNTAFGRNALELNTDGVQNSAFGTNALSVNISGNENTAFGSGALSNNTVSENVAFGNNAGFFITTGTGNTALGSQTLSMLATTSFNTAVGWHSQLSATGTSNTSVGYASLLSKTTGDNNVAIGHGTLVFNITGGNNTAIGFQSGGFNTGDGSVFIGHQAGLNSGATSNVLYIDNTASVTPLIYGDFSTSNVGLRVSTFGADANTVLGIANGVTEVTAAIANGIQIYSVDSDDATATLGLFLEQAVEASVVFVQTDRIKIKINGVLYYLPLDAV